MWKNKFLFVPFKHSCIFYHCIMTNELTDLVNNEKSGDEPENPSRRNFIRKATLAALGLAFMNPVFSETPSSDSNSGQDVHHIENKENLNYVEMILLFFLL